ncbi:maleylacetoacetate isomerase [Paraferrimonas sedimenticola]|uniref:Maleylacetoacetate isomerase n=1 Tax=Paraferrimonas sedimenticola TaxID=375674 RepID=A0AA37RU37_9GAMM|nr:maleylacetoacetate isomerase [Paraferrimonas sedimenticola]GLP94829.1 maleylacetoacetate isomerase [Paraferrimonas sedimenticola]
MNKLYGYWRSSAAYRVRIALNYKGLDAEHVPVHLVRDGGEQHTAEYQALNASELVPTYTESDGLVLTQSIAILEYLQDTHPTPTILPYHPKERAVVRSMVQTIASDLHPLNNLRVLQMLAKMGFDDQQKKDWYRHWMLTGFRAFEALLEHNAGDYCFGDEVSMADICLVPQVYNARRFDIDLSEFKHIQRIDGHCCELSAFAMAQPEQQPDAGS